MWIGNPRPDNRLRPHRNCGISLWRQNHLKLVAHLTVRRFLAHMSSKPPDSACSAKAVEIAWKLRWRGYDSEDAAVRALRRHCRGVSATDAASALRVAATVLERAIRVLKPHLQTLTTIYQTPRDWTCRPRAVRARVGSALSRLSLGRAQGSITVSYGLSHAMSRPFNNPETPNHALLTRHDVLVCNHCVPCAGPLSLGR